MSGREDAWLAGIRYVKLARAGELAAFPTSKLVAGDTFNPEHHLALNHGYQPGAAVRMKRRPRARSELQDQAHFVERT